MPVTINITIQFTNTYNIKIRKDEKRKYQLKFIYLRMLIYGKRKIMDI